jgi:hypothetical protein
VPRARGGAAPWIMFAALAILGGCHKSASQPEASNATTQAPAPAQAAAPPPSAPQNWTPDAPNPAVSVSLDPLPTQPGDLADSHDIAFLKRFQGAAILGYVARPYDKLTFYDSTGSTDQDSHRLTLEGQVTRIVYRVPAGHGALEVLRNYEDLAKGAGLARTSEQPCVSTYGSPAPAIWEQLPTGKLDNPAYVGGTNPDFEHPHCYFTARAVVNGRPLMLAVYVAEKHKFLNQTGFDGKPLAWKDGEVVAIVDVVAAKPVANQMVTVKAADMADALASKGKIDLYGIYFDTDKTRITWRFRKAARRRSFRRWCRNTGSMRSGWWRRAMAIPSRWPPMPSRTARRRTGGSSCAKYSFSSIRRRGCNAAKVCRTAQSQMGKAHIQNRRR